MRDPSFIGMFALAALLGILPTGSAVTQTVYDSVGDLPAGDPAYCDLSHVRVRQSTDKLQIDFYPQATIPGGNQAGITATTVFEVYFDTDSNASTGTRLGDIGYDYMLRADLYQWNGKSWIDANVYWGFNQNGQWSRSDGFFIYAAWLISQRFRWEFSLVSLNWTRVDWVTRIYYKDHYAERVPDSSHATLYIDTTLVPKLDSARTEYIRIIYPETYQTVLDSYDVLHSVDAGARVESAVCGTEFADKPLGVEFSPWLNGVAYSGNPVKMGSWNWGTTPSWFIFFHELGHDFTLAASRFRKLYPGGGYVSAGGDDWHYGTNFDEAWATMVGLYASHELFTKPTVYGIAATATADLQQQYFSTRNSFRNALETYEQNPDHSRLYPDLVDGIFLALADSFGYDIFPRFFKMLQPPDEPWFQLDAINPQGDYDGAKIISFTITACAFGVAARVDLRNLFKTRWDFPVDDVLYAQLLPEITAMINTPDVVQGERTAVPISFRTLGNYPNPFNGSTHLCFQMPERSVVVISIFNTLGERLQRLNLGVLPAGNHQVAWDAGNMPSGVYYYTVATERGRLANRLVILR